MFLLLRLSAFVDVVLRGNKGVEEKPKGNILLVSPDVLIFPTNFGLGLGGDALHGAPEADGGVARPSEHRPSDAIHPGLQRSASHSVGYAERGVGLSRGGGHRGRGSWGGGVPGVGESGRKGKPEGFWWKKDEELEDVLKMWGA